MDHSMKTRLRSPVRGKILLGFAAVFSLLLATSAIACIWNIRNGRTIGNIERNILPDTLDFMALESGILRIQHLMTYAAAAGDPQGSARAEELYGTVSSSFADLVKAHEAEGKRELAEELAEARQQFDEFMSMGMQMIDTYVNLGADAGSAMMASWNPIADGITAGMQALVEQRKASMKGDFEDLLANFDLSVKVTIGAAIVASLVGWLIAFRLSGSISRSIGTISRLARCMSEGDLTARVDLATGDEIELLAEDLNNALSGVKALVDEAKRLASENDSGATELASKMAEAKSAAAAISLSADRVSGDFGALLASIRDSVAVIQEIFGKIEEMNESIVEQSNAVTESSSSIEEMSASLRNVDKVVEDKLRMSVRLGNMTADGGSKVDETNLSIASISKRIRLIGDLMEIISSVSSQTNVLAMNASIEAAHAGDFGKGFSVVADEIRKLAESTDEGTKDVNVSLSELIADIESAHVSSEASGSAFAGISAEVKVVADAFEEISRNAYELSKGGDEIAKAMASLLSLTESIKDGFMTIDGETKVIQRSLESIVETSARSLEALHDIDARTTSLEQSIATISESTEKNRSDMEKLNAKIGEFKTEAA